MTKEPLPTNDSADESRVVEIEEYVPSPTDDPVDESRVDDTEKYVPLADGPGDGSRVEDTEKEDTEKEDTEKEDTEKYVPLADGPSDGSRVEDTEKYVPSADAPADDLSATDAQGSGDAAADEPVEAVGFGSSNIDSFMPIAIFLVLNSTVGLGWAIGGATAWSVKAAYSRHRQGLPIGKFLPIMTLLIVGRGLIGIVTDSEAVYFGLGIATKYAVGAFLIVSTLVGYNLIAKYAPMMFGFDEATRNHWIYGVTMRHVAFVLAIYYWISASFDIWLFNNSSTNGYVLIRTIFNWPLGLAAFGGSMMYIAYRFSAIPGFPGLITLMEDRVEQQQASWRRRG